jgi:hypothetical protein
LRHLRGGWVGGVGGVGGTGQRNVLAVLASGVTCLLCYMWHLRHINASKIAFCARAVKLLTYLYSKLCHATAPLARKKTLQHTARHHLIMVPPT